MGIAGLNEGLITPEKTINCPGYYEFGGRSWKCHGAHGATNLQKALHVSCNVFFNKLGPQLGITNFEKYGRAFGFGQKTLLISFILLGIFTLVVGEVKCNMANGDRNKQSNAKANHSNQIYRCNRYSIWGFSIYRKRCECERTIHSFKCWRRYLCFAIYFYCFQWLQGYSQQKHYCLASTNCRFCFQHPEL